MTQTGKVVEVRRQKFITSYDNRVLINTLLPRNLAEVKQRLTWGMRQPIVGCVVKVEVEVE